MDKLLKLKLELAYKDMSVEQARQHYHELTVQSETTNEEEKIEVKKVIRRKRILVKKDKE
jgi:hypothetical protein